MKPPRRKSSPRQSSTFACSSFFSLGRCSRPWCSWMARPTCPFSRYRLPRIRRISSEPGSMFAAAPSSSMARSIWPATRKLRPRMKCGELAQPAPVDPGALVQLVALPGLADGEADEQGHEGGEQRQVGFHQRRPAPASSTTRSQARLGAEDELDQLPRGAASARRLGDEVHPRPHLGRGVGGRGRQAGAREHRQVQQVVAHVGHLGVGQLPPAQDLGVGLQLVPLRLHDQADGELRGALGRGGGLAGRQEAALDPRLAGVHDARAVADVERLRLGAVAVQHDAAVGQDAVDVEQQQPDAGRLRLECALH